jgi:hypothetical protein
MKRRFAQMKHPSIRTIAYCFGLLIGGLLLLVTSVDAADPFGRSELEDTTKTQEIVKSIRDSIQMPTYEKAADVLSNISEIRSVESNTGEKKHRVIKYTNKEISDAVADLFLRACNIWLGLDEKKVSDWFGEGEESEWFLDLQEYAEATFSSKIYIYEVFYYPAENKPKLERYTLPGGRCKVQYLSNVNTTETLQIIFNSYLDPPKHNARLIYSKGNKLTNITLRDAMEVFSGICKSNSQVMQKESENVHIFIQKHIDYYAKNKINVLGEEMFDYHSDYEARYAALDVLKFYAIPADKDLIKKIGGEALLVPGTSDSSEYYSPKKMREKMQEALESIASNSVSKKDDTQKPSDQKK